MSLQCTKFADLHATCPAFLAGRPSADLTCYHKLGLWVAVKAKALELIQEHVFPALRLYMHILKSVAQFWACCGLQPM